MSILFFFFYAMIFSLIHVKSGIDFGEYIEVVIAILAGCEAIVWSKKR